MSILLVIWWILVFIGWCGAMGAFLVGAVQASRRRNSLAVRWEALYWAARYFWIVLAFTLASFILDRLLHLL